MKEGPPDSAEGFPLEHPMNRVSALLDWVAMFWFGYLVASAA